MKIRIDNPKRFAKLIAATDPLWVITRWFQEHAEPDDTFRATDEMTLEEIENELIEAQVEKYRRGLRKELELEKQAKQAKQVEG